jgi:phage terminase small subunit
MRDGVASAAAVRAGYSPKSAASTGTRLLAEPAVRAAIDAHQVEIAQEVSVSTKTLLAEAEAARTLAERVENASAMIAAVQLKARLTGLIDDKPDPERDRVAAERARANEVRTAVELWADAAESVGLDRTAAPAQIVGSGASMRIWPPALFLLAHEAAKAAEAAKAQSDEEPAA